MQFQPGRKRKRLLFERRVLLFAFLVCLPGLLVSGVFIWLQDWSLSSKLIAFAVEALVCWILVSALQEQIIRPLQTLSNVIAALREEDYSFRVRGAVPEDALGELSLEVNDLTDLLAEQSTRAMEATALLRRVVEEIDIPVFAFDPHQVLKLVNSAGERLLQIPSPRLLGSTAQQIGLLECLSAEDETIVSLPSNNPNPNVRWLLKRSRFRQNGLPHTLIVLSDVGRALREQERIAWRRLVRVLGHELNNSLTPIKSIAGALNAQVTDQPLTPSQQQDFSKGLEIIEARADSLNRFLQAYQRLAQMPPPTMRRVELVPIIERAAALERRIPVTVSRGPEMVLMVDPDQLEQMLINLVRNAVEASLDARAAQDEGNIRPEVVVRWEVDGDQVVINVEDNGTGLLNPSNAFVPFYTTKPGGSGIGLALCRQIAEAHEGSVELSNRADKKGCVVKVVLPRAAAQSSQKAVLPQR